MHHHTKFHQNHLSGCRDISFNIFKNVAVLHLWFFKNWFCEHSLGFGGPICVSMHNFIQIGRNIANYPPCFQYGGSPPFCICGANFGTTHNENLMVFITVKNLVAIMLVVLIIQKFKYFVHLARKCLLTPLFCRIWGNNSGKWKVSELLSLQKCNNLELTSYETNCTKITSAV